MSNLDKCKHMGIVALYDGGCIKRIFSKPNYFWVRKSPEDKAEILVRVTLLENETLNLGLSL
jgi:hypothetical protein